MLAKLVLRARRGQGAAQADGAARTAVTLEVHRAPRGSSATWPSVEGRPRRRICRDSAAPRGSRCEVSKHRRRGAIARSTAHGPRRHMAATERPRPTCRAREGLALTRGCRASPRSRLAVRQLQSAKSSMTRVHLRSRVRSTDGTRAVCRASGESAPSSKLSSERKGQAQRSCARTSLAAARGSSEMQRVQQRQRQAQHSRRRRKVKCPIRECHPLGRPLAPCHLKRHFSSTLPRRRAFSQPPPLQSLGSARTSLTRLLAQQHRAPLSLSLSP
jgi:hypothetical protein